MKLYDYPLSGNGYKVRLALATLEIPYEYVPLDILAGQTRTPEFLAKNAFVGKRNRGGRSGSR